MNNRCATGAQQTYITVTPQGWPACRGFGAWFVISRIGLLHRGTTAGALGIWGLSTQTQGHGLGASGSRAWGMTCTGLGPLGRLFDNLMGGFFPQADSPWVRAFGPAANASSHAAGHATGFRRSLFGQKKGPEGPFLNAKPLCRSCGSEAGHSACSGLFWLGGLRA